jgi:hypothetical protein
MPELNNPKHELVSLDREWSIPKEAREKDIAGALVQLAFHRRN